MERHAVGITGVGLATPLGHSLSAFGEQLLAGQSAIRRVTRFAVNDQPCQVAATMEPVPVPTGWDAEAFRRHDVWEQTLLWCGSQCLHDAGLWERRGQARVGLILGLGAEWLLTWEASLHHGSERIKRPETDGEGLTRFLQQTLGLSGPISTVAAACASGNIALGLARQWVQSGAVDICLAGAADHSITPMAMAGFGNLGALSGRNDQPQAALRPFDRGRDGFVMGEGGVLFVLERLSSARQRGANLYAEIAGFGARCDAHHLVIPASDAKWAADAIQAALHAAKISPDEVDYVNAHGTGTPVGDPFEARALHLALGEAALRIPVSSTKSMTGHLISAAAAVEAAACLVAFQAQAVPPTLNLDDPDPECQLCHVPHTAQPRRVTTALNNSFGFGGSNTCLVLRRVA